MTTRSITTERKLALLGSLYFSQGLPFGFFTQALPLLLRHQGASLTAIGFSSLLAAPWALKFLWAPAVDRYHHPALGRRRSWILPLQLTASVVLAAIAATAASEALPVLLAAVLLINLLSATQDVATDGLAVDMLASHERGLANGVQVAGYRVGMIVGGGALLIVHDELGPTLTFGAMALLTALASVPIVLTDEPPAASPRATPQLRRPHFVRRPGAARILLLIVTYKAGEAFASGMFRPFLADLGLGLAEVGWMVGTTGSVAGLAGAVAGGALVNPLGRRPALLIFGALQAATVASYAYLAISAPGLLELSILCGVEHFAGGMATAALFTCMMDWSRSECGATDFTVQACAMAIATGIATAISGVSADLLGYAGHFALGAALATLSLVGVARWFPTEAHDA
jgi:PAT family beta-lactamase induction signal transducer AmpG